MLLRVGDQHMTSLSDTQRILLSTASQRESGSILPLSACLASGGGIAKAVTVLVKHGFVEERETGSADEVRRTDGDLRYGAYITAAGLIAIGVGEQLPVLAQESKLAQAPTTAPQSRTSKTAAVVALLGRDGGATIAELIKATDWLQHSTRAALTGLRQKGHAVERFKRDGATCYRIVAAAE